jgi:hypothetical protein
MLLVLFVIAAGSVGGVFFIVVAFGIDGGKLKGIHGDDFEFSTALVALDRFTLFDFVYVDGQRVIAFGANYCHGPDLLWWCAILQFGI